MRIQEATSKEHGNNYSSKVDELATRAVDAYEHGKEKVQQTAEKVEKRLKEGEADIKQIIEKAEKKIQDNPWPTVLGVAAGALLVGFVMGISRK